MGGLDFLVPLRTGKEGAFALRRVRTLAAPLRLCFTVGNRPIRHRRSGGDWSRRALARAVIHRHRRRTIPLLFGALWFRDDLGRFLLDHRYPRRAIPLWRFLVFVDRHPRVVELLDLLASATRTPIFRPPR